MQPVRVYALSTCLQVRLLPPLSAPFALATQTVKANARKRPVKGAVGHAVITTFFLQPLAGTIKQILVATKFPLDDADLVHEVLSIRGGHLAVVRSCS